MNKIKVKYLKIFLKKTSRLKSHTYRNTKLQQIHSHIVKNTMIEKAEDISRLKNEDCTRLKIGVAAKNSALTLSNCCEHFQDYFKTTTKL